MRRTHDIVGTGVPAKPAAVPVRVGAPPLYRIHTVVSHSDFPIVTPEGSMRICKELLGEERWATFEKIRDADFSYEIPGLCRFRVNAHWQRSSIALAFRTINDKVRPIEALLLPEICNKLTYLPPGLILVTGPTGSAHNPPSPPTITPLTRP